jgi:hypothetical protein
MTHMNLSEICIRPPGTPPSRCPGELDCLESRTDSAQAGEGDVGDVVSVDFYRCRYCHQSIVIRHAADGWRQVFDADPEALPWSVRLVPPLWGDAEGRGGSEDPPPLRGTSPTRGEEKRRRIAMTPAVPAADHLSPREATILAGRLLSTAALVSALIDSSAPSHSAAASNGAVVWDWERMAPVDRASR